MQPTGRRTTVVAAVAIAAPPQSQVGALIARIDTNGLHTRAQTFAAADALAVQEAGYARAMNVKSATTPDAPTTPAGLDTYRGRLDGLLGQIHPALLVVEDEETAEKFVNATADQYLAELQVAVDVAPAHGQLVTAGGIPFPIIALTARAEAAA